MKKILLASDGSHFSEGAFEFARCVNELEPILLTGVFLPQAQLANLWSYADGMTGPLFVPLVESGEESIVEENVERFKHLCEHNNIDYRVHKDYYDFALPELKKETRFADLLIIGSETFYANMGTEKPNEYLKEVLHGVECPVLLVPEKFKFPESNILAYDGSGSSVYAIKQFAYLFPGLCNNETLLVFSNEEGKKDFPDRIPMEELASRHFPRLTLFKLQLNPKKYFAAWISEKKGAFLVSGAYGRSGFSELFKKSFVNDVISDHQLPLFVTHY
jgi:hypothetical protein